MGAIEKWRGQDMTLQECYQNLGGDFTQLKQRFPSVQMVKRIITKFLEDKTISELCHAIENERGKDAFLAAYTLQGVCANLCFDKLLASTVQMTALLSPETNTITENCYLFLEAVKQDYKLTVSSIRTYLDSEHEE